MTGNRQPPNGRTMVAIGLAALVSSGCSSMPSFAPKSPFGSSSTVDQTFVGAAQTWDFDKNGAVTCDEWKNYATTSLRESDSDGNGSLDAAEFGKMAQTDRLFEVANLSYYDGSGDGRVTVEELTGKQNVAFKMLDKNSDCQIDRNETVQIVQRDKPKAADVPQDTTRRGGGGY
jgi:Ca2+-binding EF-hand superfamily protein